LNIWQIYIDFSCFLSLDKNSGNPAAVCLLEDDIPDQLKQQIAAEMNISETAFLTTAAGIYCQLAENSAA
jgi:predicted PhzF superfamily epimerase YddE/YHI9